ncbi:hypothetical protein AAF712_005160 [Marasmius tenuissimus]|uniref:Uncharacterized protein n=1 Tax=Marasmius tenuissimus TaxID=585030 RepID=A0ABR3A2G3_9AGAR
MTEPSTKDMEELCLARKDDKGHNTPIPDGEFLEKATILVFEFPALRAAEHLLTPNLLPGGVIVVDEDDRTRIKSNRLNLVNTFRIKSNVSKTGQWEA